MVPRLHIMLQRRIMGETITFQLQEGAGKVCMCLGYIYRLDICLWELDGKLGQIRCLMKKILVALMDKHILSMIATI